MIFDDRMIDRLRLSVKDRLSDKRFKHTLGVENMARRLGEIIIPERLDELRVAALLHDVAKELSFEEQLSLLSHSTVKFTKEDVDTRPALHSIAAIPLIKREYPEYATDNVLSAVANHTLGDENMSAFDAIIYISDYAEEGRTYRTCCEVRDYLINNVRYGRTMEENLQALHSASLSATESTIWSLSLRGEKIHTKTFTTKAYLKSLISK